MNYIDKKTVAGTLAKFLSDFKPEVIESYLEIPPSEIDLLMLSHVIDWQKSKKKPQT